MFKTRLLSGIVLVAIAVASVAAGGPILFAVLLAISLIGVGELYRAMEVHQKGFGALEIAGYVGTVLYYLSLLWVKTDEFSMMILLFALVLIMCVYVFTYPKYRAEQIMAALFGIFYVAVMLSYIYKTRTLEGGAWLVGLIFLSSWGSDTCAYCFYNNIVVDKVTLIGDHNRSDYSHLFHTYRKSSSQTRVFPFVESDFR